MTEPTPELLARVESGKRAISKWLDRMVDRSFIEMLRGNASLASFDAGGLTVILLSHPAATVILGIVDRLVREQFASGESIEDTHDTVDLDSLAEEPKTNPNLN